MGSLAGPATMNALGGLHHSDAEERVSVTYIAALVVDAVADRIVGLASCRALW